MKRSYDSHEEKYIDWYLQSLLNNGYIKKYTFHHKTYDLSIKIVHKWKKKMKRVEDKDMETTVLQPHTYTPDVLVEWNKIAEGIFYQNLTISDKLITPFIAQNDKSIWEIKGSFDFQNMTRLVTLNIKWVMEKYQDYIQIIVPNKIFNTTFTPQRYLLTDKSFILRKLKYKNVRTIREFTDSISK